MRECVVNGQHKIVAKVMVEETNRMINELAIGSSITHPNINSTRTIVHRIKYTDGSSFNKIIVLQDRAQCDTKKLESVGNEPLVMKILHHTLQGLDCLHSLGIVHCDIKAGNVLYFPEQDTFKIADFSLSVINGTNKIGVVCGNGYTPPEILYSTKPKTRVTYAVDVWSVGCMLYRLYYGKYMYKPPRKDCDDKRSVELNNLEVGVKQAGKLSGLVASVIQDCVHLDPESRLSVKQLLEKYFPQSKSVKYVKHVPVRYSIPNHLDRMFGEVNSGLDARVQVVSKKVLSACVPIHEYLGSKDLVIGCNRVAYQLINQARRPPSKHGEDKYYAGGEVSEIHVCHYLSFRLIWFVME